MGSSTWMEVEIDPDIRDIIAMLNSLDFLETTDCCSGHPNDPDPKRKRRIPFIMLKYDKRMESMAHEFHDTLVKTIPNLKFMSIKHTGVGSGTISKGLTIAEGTKTSYDMKIKSDDLTKKGVDEFWDRWRQVLIRFVK